MPVFPDFSLQPHNALGVAVNARYFIEVHHLDELLEGVSFAQHRGLPIMVLGQGSNVVFTKDFPGLVIKNSLFGIDVVAEHDDYSLVKSGAGETWQSLVDYTQHYHLWGLENLTAIPGTVGAAPIQNIGAYGVELKDFFVELQALDIQSQCMVSFDVTGCRFGYRDSVFKQRMRDKFIIVSVTLKLLHQPQLVLNYGPLRDLLVDKENVSPTMVEQTVRKIRAAKLPDPSILPNVGSFFKNPVVSEEQYQALRQQYPELVAFPIDEQRVKLSAGWLIEQAGWKGYRKEGVGVHDQQALVLVNYDKKSGSSLMALAEDIQASVAKKYAIQLEVEPSVF